MAINTSNTLLDNSAQFRMVDYLTALLRDERHTELKIATGYWDLPGTKLLYEPLKEFFEQRQIRFAYWAGTHPAGIPVGRECADLYQRERKAIP